MGYYISISLAGIRRDQERESNKDLRRDRRGDRQYISVIWAYETNMLRIIGPKKEIGKGVIISEYSITWQ